MHTSHIGNEEERVLQLRQALSMWFYNAPFYSIKRDNLSSWVVWAFFDTDISNLNKSEKNNVEELLLHIEKCIHHKFESGENSEVKCIRLNLDEVKTSSRPVIYYLAVSSVQCIGEFLLYLIGFHSKFIHINGGKVMMYYHRPANLDLEKAVFANSIGYIHYFRMLLALTTDAPVYLVSLPYICMQLVPNSPLLIQETVQVIQTVLHKDGHSDARFVAHSFGTIIMTWILRDEKRRQIVSSVTFIDPIVFLLSDPSVAFNFLHRVPSNSVELMMHYFVARELYIAETLCRNFSWSHAILFGEELINMNLKTTVILSGKDVIVPARKVFNYFENLNKNYNNNDNKNNNNSKNNNDNTSIEVLWRHDKHHVMLL